MNKKLPLISLFIMSIVSIFYWTFKPKELYEAKWNAPDTTLAITINGEISTTFPTTNAYGGTVTCTTGTGSISWNGTKWVLTTSGITKGSTKCNIIFKTKTFAQTILTNNKVSAPITTPGVLVSAHTLEDVQSETESVDSDEQAYYITYGTGWTANGTMFNLTGAAVTSATYANSYSGLVGKYLPYSSLFNAGSSTAGTIKTTTNLSCVYYVVSATQDSFVYKPLCSNINKTEALIASTEDDYGTSYYFRGAVKNNYVQFANKCWRIVRIVGDGSVKLLLHNDNINGVNNPCSSVNNDKQAAFARYSGTTYYGNFADIPGGNDNALVGFMYGTPITSTSYEEAHTNKRKSNILVMLETWYKNNLISYESKLADTIWCNDKSVVTDTSFNPYDIGVESNFGYGRNRNYYNSIKRLVSSDGSAGGTGPSLICPNDNNGGKLSKFTVSDTMNGNGDLTYKIGLLTVDEAVFAGFSVKGSNYSLYLHENAYSNYATMTPRMYGGGYSSVWNISGALLYGYNVTQSTSLRPAISLVPSTSISCGSGTSEDPYVVN